jgi:adenosylhomocysteinase
VSIEEAAPSADFIVTASGASGTVTEAALARAKDGCIVASAGGTDGEIADWRKHQNVRVLTGGLGVNYTGEGAEGNPIEIMDLSFAAQFSALKYLIENRGNLPRKVIELPEEISEKIAGERLRK